MRKEPNGRIFPDSHGFQLEERIERIEERIESGLQRAGFRAPESGL
jgi:hypothetical protein